MRRLLTGSLAFLALTGTVLVAPVYASPGPEAEPVPTSTDEVVMGSVEDPAPAADVQEGTSEPVAGVAETAPTLTVTRTGVPEFSLVGVTWAHDPAVTDTVVKVRVQDGAGAWGEWTEVGTETADQGSDDTGADLRGGTSPLWTGPSTGVEAELVTRSGAAPTDVQLDLVDPGESEADTALGAPDIQDTADAALAMPAVYSRAQWGADEKIRTWDPQYAPTIKAATVHHTADSNNYTADQVPAIMRSIYRYHTVSLGWGDIGYNVIVDKFGRLWEGRAGGLASTVIGAHAGGFNIGTFGVSMLGNYDLIPVPQATVNSVAAIIAWKFSLYGINPRGTTTLVSAGGGTARYAKGTAVTLPTIFGHRDVGSTVCPGQYGYSRLPAIRDIVTAQVGKSPIQQRYESDAALRTALGAPTSEITCGLAGGGCFQHYRNGSLYYSPATGVHAVTGSVYSEWAATGWEWGPLGYPVSDVSITPDGKASYAHFQRGSVYVVAGLGRYWLGAELREAWGRNGWEGGPLGYPTSDERPTPDGKGRYAVFQNGNIHWTAATGAHVTYGPVRQEWKSTGYEHGPLGYPTSDVAATPDGVAQYAHFQRGSIYWTQATGAHWLGTGIRDAWGRNGWEGGPLGYPTSDERPTPDGKGRYAVFQNGNIHWTAATGAHVTYGPVRQEWKSTGYEHGPLGYPTSDVAATPDGVAQYAHFQGGSVYSTAEFGTHWLPTAIRDEWGRRGWEGGELGYPVSDPQSVSGGTRVDFQHGSLTVDSSGRVTVSTS